MRVVWQRLRGAIDRRRLEQRLAEEMRTHLDLLTEEKLRAGLSPEQARRAAAIEFGGVSTHMEDCRDQAGAPWLESVWHDLRYAARGLRRSRVFTVSAVLTLALALGGAAVVLSLVQGLLLRGLPYADPARLVQLQETSARAGVMSASWHDFLDWRAQARSFAGMAAIRPGSLSLTGDGPAERLPVLSVTAGFFPMLGVAPALGRGFTAADDRDGADPVVLLTHALWQRRYGADPAILGRRIAVDGQPHLVVGILPAGFRFFEQADLYRPLAPQAVRLGPRGGDHGCYVFGRLAPGVTAQQAGAEMRAIADGLGRQYPRANAGVTVQIQPLTAADPALRRTLYLLLAAVACLLFIACVNVSGLLLARGEARRREMRMRAALGAGRGRLLQQVLVESLLLAGLGAALGLAAAHWSLPLLNGLLPEDTARVAAVRIDGMVFAAASLIAAVVALGMGVVPGWTATGLRPGRFRWRGAFVALQVGASFVLLAGSGLLLRSVLNIQQVDPGFRAERLLLAETALPPARFPEPEGQIRYLDRLLAELRAEPGIASAATTFCLPLNGGCWGSGVAVEGAPAAARQDRPMVDVNEVSPGYFVTLGTPLLAGRDFSTADTPQTPPVAIVSAAFARKFFPRGGALGRRIELGDKAPFTIVGIAGDIHRVALTAAVRPEVYRCVRQFGAEEARLVVKTRLRDPMALAEAVRRAAARVDAGVPLYALQPIDVYVDQSTESRRLPLLVVGVFALLALGMAAIGVYGTVSFTVTARARDLGIRVALGATRGRILALVFGQSARLALAGLAAGALGAAALARILRSLLFGVSAADPATFAAVAAALALVLLLAAWAPARRAARVDPAVTLRGQ